MGSEISSECGSDSHCEPYTTRSFIFQVTSPEIQRLYARFQKLDKNGNGRIDKAEFLALPQIKRNPLASRLIDLFDIDGSGDVDFKEFILGLSTFSSRGTTEEKLRLAFNVYDVDGNGLITNEELFSTLKIMVGSNLAELQLHQIVDKTIRDADLNGDGMIDFDEFRAIISSTDISKGFTFAASKV